ncbi:MAG: hypothetical protein K0S07_1206 [Chlamydiales bacterium]|jgi:hypothetical protein|nr:hypothetical protein [Chlamydiales bacterium]
MPYLSRTCHFIYCRWYIWPQKSFFLVKKAFSYPFFTLQNRLPLFLLKVKVFSANLFCRLLD